MQHEDKFVRFAVPLFMLANAATMVLYFAAFHDPQATTKLGWADYLG